MSEKPNGSSQEEEFERSAKGDEEPPAYDAGVEDYAGISSARFDSLEDLRDAKAFAEMIVDTVREGLLVLDFGLRIKAANESFYQTFQVSPDQTIGRLIYDLGNGQWDIPQLRDLLENVLPTDTVFNDYGVTHEFETIGKREMRLNARRLDDHELILLAIDDVTERVRSERELRAAQDRFDLIVENTRDYAVIAMGPDRRITTWNPAAERILGWKADEAIGQSADLIFTAEDRAADVPQEEMGRAQADGSARDERWHVRKDGRRFWGNGFVVALKEEERNRGFVKILRDETDRKETQEALRRLNEELEDRVEERTRKVRELASSLTMAEQQERRRISQILHDDLQQVLYGVQMKLRVAREDAEAGNEAAIKESFDEADAWIRKSIDLTRSLTVDLSPPILKSEGLTEALGWLQAQMKELHDMDVTIDAERSFRTPEEDMRVLLFQIVRELLFNVVKHAGTKQAAVALRAVDHRIEISVTDEGNGFDVEAAESSASDERFGLFSVRERLGLFGGGMRIESSKGNGTCVTVDAPLRLE